MGRFLGAQLPLRCQVSHPKEAVSWCLSASEKDRYSRLQQRGGLAETTATCPLDQVAGALERVAAIHDRNRAVRVDALCSRA